MSEPYSVSFGSVKFKTGDGYFQVGSDKFVDLTLEDIGRLSELLADAWDNIAAEQYKPLLVSDGGYVVDGGVAIEFVERDCE